MFFKPFLLSIILFQLRSVSSSQIFISSTTSSPDLSKNEDRLALLESQLAQLAKQLKPTSVPQSTLPKNCKEVQEQGHTASKVYLIQPKYAPKPFSAFCNMKTRGGGWTYILNRYDGSLDFYQNWHSYKHGFGNLDGEFWLGLEKIHLLTGYEINELLIELEDWNNVQKDAHYKYFSITDEDSGYALDLLHNFNGNAGDAFKNEQGMKFTTKDRDQDVWGTGNCAVFSEAAWWYRDCKWAHLTGRYLGPNVPKGEHLKGIYWTEFHGNTYSMKKIRMMVRPHRPRNINPLS